MTCKKKYTKQLLTEIKYYIKLNNLYSIIVKRLKTKSNYSKNNKKYKNPAKIFQGQKILGFKQPFETLKIMFLIFSRRVL